MQEYREKGFIPDKATYRCQSPDHNEDSANITARNETWEQGGETWTIEHLPTAIVWILGVRCDGIGECWGAEGAEDEQGCGASREDYAYAGMTKVWFGLHADTFT